MERGRYDGDALFHFSTLLVNTLGSEGDGSMNLPMITTIVAWWSLFVLLLVLAGTTYSLYRTFARTSWNAKS